MFPARTSAACGAGAYMHDNSIFTLGPAAQQGDVFPTRTDRSHSSESGAGVNSGVKSGDPKTLTGSSKLCRVRMVRAAAGARSETANLVILHRRALDVV